MRRTARRRLRRYSRCISSALAGLGWRRWRPARTGGRLTASVARATARCQASSQRAHDSSEGGSRSAARSRRARSSRRYVLSGGNSRLGDAGSGCAGAASSSSGSVTAPSVDRDAEEEEADDGGRSGGSAGEAREQAMATPRRQRDRAGAEDVSEEAAPGYDEDCGVDEGVENGRDKEYISVVDDIIDKEATDCLNGEEGARESQQRDQRVGES
ncbi:hypothetical protein MTO96_048508 [Rhipicephalus appendiculatus]